ncbi:MAG: ribosome silencing factor [Spirochaetales bacterium]|nr:ribosome silencing factor [Spirochaetales bacterium]
MEDMYNKRKDQIIDLAKLLEEHKAEKVIVLYVGENSSWTDFFIIATPRSRAHLQGLIRHLQDFFSAQKIQPLHSRKSGSEAGWILIDCGYFIVHLMEEEQREFYELEKLWFKCPEIYSSRSS